MQWFRYLGLFGVSMLFGTAVHAEDTLVIAVAELATEVNYESLAQPGCNKSQSSDEIVVCTGGWVRYKLSKVVRLDGVTLDDTTALIYTDQQIDGPKLLQLETLTEPDAQRYGAPYKAVSVTTVFSGACVDKELPLQPDDKILGPTQIELTPQAKCYLLPAWWAR